MPQMYPISWIFIYFYTLLGLIMVLVLVSYVYSFSVDKILSEGVNVVEFWLW